MSPAVKHHPIRIPKQDGLGFLAALEPAFSGKTPTIVSDHLDLVRTLRESGFAAVAFDEIEGHRGPDDAVIIITDYAKTPGGTFFEDTFGESRTLGLPLASFESSPRAIEFTFKAVSHLDLAACAVANAQLLEMLETMPGSARLVGPGCDCEITFADELDLLEFKMETELVQREWAAVVSYLEVAMISKADKVAPNHRVTGEFTANGVSVAQHRNFPQVVGPMAAAAWENLCKMRAADEFPLRVAVADSVITEIRGHRTGVDVLSLLLPHVDKRQGKNLAELAFASVPKGRFEPDWSVNSPLNEAVSGVHLALGTGLFGAHIDLIGTDVRLERK